MNILFAPLITFIYVLACLGIGYGLHAALVRCCGQLHDDASISIRIALRFLLGIFLIGSILTLLGLAGLLNREAVIGLTLLGLGSLGMLGRADMLSIPNAIQISLRAWRHEPLLLQSLAVFVGLAIAAFAIAALVLPPIGDAEAFYIAYAKIMAAAGRLAPMLGTYTPFSTIGLPVELHFAALIIMAGVPAAKFLVWFIALSVGILLMGLSRQSGADRKGELFALAILFSSSTFTFYITDGKVDLVAAAYGLAAFYIIIAGIEPTRAVLSGVFAGAATVAKFSYLPAFCPALAILMLWQFHAGRWQLTREGLRQLASTALLAALGFLLAWIPHLIKNAVLFSAPLAPFIGGPEGGYLDQTWFDPEVTRRIVLSYPLALVFGRYPMQGGGLSLLMIAFIPLLVLQWKAINKISGPLLPLTVAGIVGTLFWVVLRPSVIAPRYILAPLLLLVPIVAIGVQIAWTEMCSKLLRFGIVSTIICAFVLPVLHLKGTLTATANFIGGEKNTCTQASDYCEPLQALNRHALPGERIYLAGYYGYWLRADLLQCRNSRSEDSHIGAATNVVTTLRTMGFHFIAIDRTAHARLLEQLETSDIGNSVKEVFHNASMSVFELPAPQTGSPVCTQTRPGEWQVSSK